jgi:RNA polymerase sigma-70 factor (ECF subfamily)
VLTLDQTDPRDLMVRAAAGDQAAFSEVYTRWRPYVAAIIRRGINDPGRVADLVQETMLHAWRGIGSYQPAGPDPRAWLATIARRVVIDDYRRSLARPVEAMFGDVADMPAPLVDPYTQILDRAQAAAVLDQLVDEHREALVLHHMVGLTMVEVAARLGVPLGTLKSRLFYGTRAARRAAEVTPC